MPCPGCSVSGTRRPCSGWAPATSSDDARLGRADGFGAADAEPLAAGDGRNLPRPLPLLYRAAQDFSSYQSDGMLLEAAFLCLLFSPRGFRPGLGADQPPSRVSLFLLRWEWFRIYFESGVVKLASGDPQWRT